MLKIRRAEGESVSKILEFALDRYGECFFQQGSVEFELWGTYEADQMHREAMLLPWLAFNFRYNADAEDDGEGEDFYGLEDGPEDYDEPDEDLDLDEAELPDKPGESHKHTWRPVPGRSIPPTELTTKDDFDGDDEFDGDDALDEFDDDGEIDGPAEYKLPAGVDFLNADGPQLDPYQRAFIREACSQPYSFFVVTGVTPGKSLDLKDIFLPRTFTVRETAASVTLKRGQVVFTRVVELEGLAIMLGVAPISLPPVYHTHLLDLRDRLKKDLQIDKLHLSQDLMLSLDQEMREYYFQALESLYAPTPPEIRNTDGDPLQFVKLYFKLTCPPGQAAEKLKSLALPEFQDGIRNGAQFDSEGNMVEVSFPWQKRGSKSAKAGNTILGSISIKEHLLTVEVNSEKRAEKIKAEIAKRLKGQATFRNAAYESMESKLEEMENLVGTEEWQRMRQENQDLQSRPEVQELLKKQHEAHWEAWYNQKVPALKNKTPMQAAKTEDGRERLEALLLEFETREEDKPDYLPRLDVAAMRKRLGLSPN